MQKIMRNKALPLLLALAMTASLAIVPAGAEGRPGEPETEQIPVTFAVTVDADITGGTVAVQPREEVAEGTAVTVAVTAAEGYALTEGTLAYTTDGENYTEITEIGDAYTFVMPAADVVVTAAFEAAFAGDPQTEDTPAQTLEAPAPVDGSTVHGGETISADGVYQLAAGATGVITIGTGVTEVTLAGNGAEWDSGTGEMTTAPCENLCVDATAAPGVTLTLKDVYLNNTSGMSRNSIDFSGQGNRLAIEGICVLDHDLNMSGYAGIHVNKDTSLTIAGAGTLYFYKQEQGAGIGGDAQELNGDITFAMTGSAFIKGTKQGAVIGQGADSKSAAGEPGTITFESGDYNLISNSRGGVIGGSAGSGGASTGTKVYFKGGTVNINVDYSGSAVGGGGYDGGNDAAGGSAYFSGGSVRVYVDKNAAGHTDWGEMSEGVNDLAITAAKRDLEGNPVYKCVIDTKLLKKSAESFEIEVDGKPFYTGGLHKYRFVQEALDKGDQANIMSTPSNWTEGDDTHLYLYLTGKNHVLTVNGETFQAVFDEAVCNTAAAHTVGVFKTLPVGSPDADVWDGTLDFSWYDANDVKAEYHITKPAQWAALAWICSEHLGELNELGAGTYTNGNVTGIAGVVPAKQNTFTGVKFYLDNDLDMGGVYDGNAGTWSGPNYYPVGSQVMNDLGNGNFFGLFYGSFDGQGHTVANIYCDRGAGQAWQSAGLFGRVGAADGQPAPTVNIVIENVAVSGSIKSGRSVGGIVGKTLHVAPEYQVTIQNCLNFATIISSDAKGTGGICGAGWNQPAINNCANFGTVIAHYKNGGGICGSFEGTSERCYNMGDVSQSAVNNGQAFGTNNGGAKVYHFYWLTGTSNVEGKNAAIYNPSADSTTVEITDHYDGTELTAAAYMKSEAFLTKLNAGGDAWTLTSGNWKPVSEALVKLAGDYPVPKTMTIEHTFSDKWSADETYHWHSCNISGCTDVSGRAEHVWNDGEVTLEPTSNTNGIKTYTCTVCGKTKTETIPATGGGSGEPTKPDTSGMDLTSPRWDGVSVDVSWYLGNEGRSTYTIGTAAELAGTAALVNGLVNSDCEVYTGDEVLTAARWNNSAYVKNGSGTSGGNNQSTNDFSYGVENFNGKTLALDTDLDMGAGNYMPIGGQYLMTDENTATKIGASFCGFLDGQGHTVTIRCDRHCDGNYGDGQSIGLIGRLGVHDRDDTSLRPAGAGVRDLAVYGSVRGNRSVGGIVGKIGKTNGGAVIENCANFASVSGTDAKGTGGIVGAAWNGGEIRNCYNAGAVSNSHNAYGGIAGSCEISLENCFNVGKVTGAGKSAAIASDNGGSTYKNCYWLEGTADVGVYNKNLDSVVVKTADEMKEAGFLSALGAAFVKDTLDINSGYPVLTWQNAGGQTGTGTGAVGSKTEESETKVKTETIVTKGQATVTVDAKALAKAAESADKNTRFVISGDLDGKTVDKVTATAARSSLKAVADAGASVKVSSPITDVVLSNTVLKELTGGSGKEITVASEQRTDGAVAITVAVDGKTVETVKGGLKAVIPLPSALKPAASGSEGQAKLLPGVVAVLVTADGSETVLKSSVAYGSGALVLLDGSAAVRLVDNSKAFSDVSATAWYATAVSFAASHELFQGTGKNQFSPLEDMTRGMLVTVLARLEGVDVMPAAGESWYDPGTAWARENGISDGTAPDGSITREQLATMLCRYAKAAGLNTGATGDLKQFADSGEVSDWAEEAVIWAVGSGILTGKGNSGLDPAGTASRAEVATMLQRLVVLMVK